MIYITRHGQTDWNIAHKIQGQTDIPLNDFGIKQATEQAKNIKDLKIDKIYSSDLSRTIKTAEILNTNFNAPIYLDKELREVGFGTIEGRNANSLSKEDILDYRENPEKYNAETKEHLFNRVKNVFYKYSKSTENILLVTHGGFIHMMLYYIDHPDNYDPKLFLEKYKPILIKNLNIYKLENNTISLYKENNLV